MSTRKIGIVILAAGGSTRFGASKQLLKLEGRSLLRRAVDAAISPRCCNIVVVLGEDHRNSEDEISTLPVEIVVNNDWQSGISSSINLGLKKILDDEPELAAVIFMLCDQPFVNSDTISRLIDAYGSTQKPIVASRYDGTLGVPALFDREMFPELLDLQGYRGEINNS